MVSIHIKIILIISILINIIFLFISYFLYKVYLINDCNLYSIYNHILISNIKDIAKSGDLLLFSNSNFNIITRTIGNPAYSHIGIVIKINNKLYSLELVKTDYVYPKQPEVSGTICIPLEDRLANYSGQVFYCKLNKNLSENKQKILLNRCYNKQSYSTTNTCGHFIANLIEELDIAKNITTWKFWQIHNNIIKLCNGKLYDYPVVLISDSRLLNNIYDNKLLTYC